MNNPLNLADIFTGWLRQNAQRIAARFESERIGDWSGEAREGIVLDLWNDRVSGRITAWPQHLAMADWPFADAEIISSTTEETLFVESFVEFNGELLNRWLLALEAHSISN